MELNEHSREPKKLYGAIIIEVVDRAGFEPATFRLSVERSSRAELPVRLFQM